MARGLRREGSGSSRVVPALLGSWCCLWSTVLDLGAVVSLSSTMFGWQWIPVHASVYGAYVPLFQQSLVRCWVLLRSARKFGFFWETTMCAPYSPACWRQYAEAVWTTFPTFLREGGLRIPRLTLDLGIILHALCIRQSPVRFLVRLRSTCLVFLCMASGKFFVFRTLGSSLDKALASVTEDFPARAPFVVVRPEMLALWPVWP